MKLLEQRILEEGQVRPGNVLKVDCFLNHQLDVELLDRSFTVSSKKTVSTRS